MVTNIMLTKLAFFFFNTLLQFGFLLFSLFPTNASVVFSSSSNVYNCMETLWLCYLSRNPPCDANCSLTSGDNDICFYTVTKAVCSSWHGKLSDRPGTHKSEVKHMFSRVKLILVYKETVFNRFISLLVINPFTHRKYCKLLLNPYWLTEFIYSIMW